MGSLVDAINDAITTAVGKGDWNSVSADDGRYEGSLTQIDIDSIEIENCDIDAEIITVVAKGLGTIFHKDSDGNEHEEERDVKVTAQVTIGVTGNVSDGLTVTLNVKIGDVSLDEAA